MIEWQNVQLADLVRFRNGKSPKGLEPGAYPVYGSNGIIGTCAQHMYEKAIILGRVGAYCGSVEYCPGKFWATDNTIVIETLEQYLDTVFAAYMFRLANLNRYAGGSAQPLLTQTNLKGLYFYIPPVEIQYRIASILVAYDDLIETNRRRIAALDAMARGLFEEWFVRFRFPGHDAVQILDTPDGPLPNGWLWGSLIDLLSLPYGKALKAEARRPGNVSVIGSSGIVGSHIESLVAGPGIVVGRKGNVGSIIWSATDFWPIDTTYYVDTSLPLTYIYRLLQRVSFENSHAAVPGLNRDYALAKKIVIAPEFLAQRYGAFAEPLMDQITTLEISNERLVNSRDLLLPRLISGQLPIAEAERKLEEAA